MKHGRQRQGLQPPSSADFAPASGFPAKNSIYAGIASDYTRNCRHDRAKDYRSRRHQAQFVSRRPQGTRQDLPSTPEDSATRRTTTRKSTTRRSDVTTLSESAGTRSHPPLPPSGERGQRRSDVGKVPQRQRTLDEKARIRPFRKIRLIRNPSFPSIGGTRTRFETKGAAEYSEAR